MISVASLTPRRGRTVEVLLLAIALVWWLGASLWAAAAVVALCYYPTLARIVRRRVRRRVR